MLINSKVDWILFLSKSMKLLRSKVLTPWSRVVPMGCFKLIFLFLVHKFQIWLSSFLKVAAIDSFVSCGESTNLEIRLTHFSFFILNIKERWTLILWVLALWYGDRLLWCYNISRKIRTFQIILKYLLSLPKPKLVYLKMCAIWSLPRGEFVLSDM